MLRVKQDTLTTNYTKGGPNLGPPSLVEMSANYYNIWMKYFLALLITLHSFTTLACTNFSGKYLGDNSTSYTIEQNDCFMLQMGTEKIFTDGINRIKEESDTLRISTSASFIDYYLSVENIIEYKKPFPEGMPVELIPAKFIILYIIDGSGNLARDTTVYNSSDVVISSDNSIHQKIDINE